MNTLPTSGKELRVLRLQSKVSRRRLAAHMDRSEERVAQIERKRCVRPEAVRRYRAGLEAAIKIREVVYERGAK
jgi:transcriptional regulator with XRE-family HTH domain